MAELPLHAFLRRVYEYVLGGVKVVLNALRPYYELE